MCISAVVLLIGVIVMASDFNLVMANDPITTFNKRRLPGDDNGG